MMWARILDKCPNSPFYGIHRSGLFIYWMPFHNYDCRTLDDIQSLAGLAKLEPEQLMPGVQCLSFTDEMDNEAVMLMEVDGSLLDHLMVGDRLV